MPDVKGGLVTPISSAMTRLVSGVRDSIRSVGTSNWFGPLQPLKPMAPDDVKGRQWNYPVGLNLNYVPRGESGTDDRSGVVSFEELRSLADNLPILRLVIETRKDQVESIGWMVKPKGVKGGKFSDAEKLNDPRIKQVTQFLASPDQRSGFATWMRQLLEEVFVTDALTIYPRMKRGGGLYSLDLIDGATVKSLIDATGRPPVPPDPAYQQILHGIPAADFSRDELLYLPRNRRVNRLYGFCFAPGTEILTREGWKQIDGLSSKDQLATRQPVTHEFQWQSPIALTSREFSGDLIRFSNSMGGAGSVDILVTPEHKMIVRNQRTGREQLMPAEDLAGKSTKACRWRIPLAADSWNGVRIVEKRFANEETLARNVEIRRLRQAGLTYREIAEKVDCAQMTAHDVASGRYAYDGRGAFKVDVLSGDNFCAFMGMYLSEGSTNKDRIVVVSQTKSQTAEKFKEKLTECFGLVEYDGRDFRVHRTRVAEYVGQFGKSYEKFVPEEIMNATSEQIEIFLDYLFDGDAHRSRSGQTLLYTTSARLADQVQELCQKIGKPASVTKLAPRGSVMTDGRVIEAENCRPQYRVSVNRRKFVRVLSSRVPYKGPVHCVSVPNKSVLVRRNGRAAWTSQSPVEQIILAVNIALRREIYTLNYYKEGTLPEAFGTLPKEWTQEQIGSFQAYFDALLTDNLADRRKLRFMPDGFKFEQVRQPPLKDAYDEWLARVVCYAFSVPPTPFVSQVNRATSDSLRVEASHEGLIPLKNWIKAVFDLAIQRYMGFSDLEFAWDDSDTTDPLQRAQADQIDIASRVKTVNEVRDERGLPPLPDDQADGAPPPTALDIANARGNAFGGKKPGDGEDDAEKLVKTAPFAAGICFLTPDRKALFLRRTGDDHGGEWCLPGGKVEPGEAPNEAAAREAAEEAGVRVNPDDLWQMFSTTTVSDSGPQFATFLHYVPGKQAVTLDEKESSDFLWASIDNPPQPLHPGVSRTLPMLAGYKHPAEKLAKYSPNQSRDSHGRFAPQGTSGLVQTRRRKPREVAGAKWDATTQSGVRYEAAIRAVKGAARIGGAAFAAGYIPALRLAVKRGAFTALLGATGSGSVALWAAKPAAVVVGTAASLVLSGIAGEGVHDIFTSGHALLEQACDALGVHRAYADRAVTLVRSIFYGTLDELAPGLRDIARDIGKAADDQKPLHQLLEIWREHGDASATAWAEGFKKEIEKSDLDDGMKEFSRKFADGTREIFLKALAQAEHEVETGKHEKLAKASETWPEGKAPKPKHARNLRSLWQEIFKAASKKAAAALRASYTAKLAKGGDTVDVDFSDYEDQVTEALAEAASDGGGAGLNELFDKFGEPASGSIRTAVFDAAQERAHTWAAQHAAELVSQVSDTTREMLRDVIADGLSDGLTIPEIADEIESAAVFSDERAATIAQTEVTNANSAGALEGYRAAQDSGLKVKKGWLNGANPCPVCQENAAAGFIELDDEFPSGDMAPAAHPHCQCSVTCQAVEDDGEA